jgi:hypothetical protein
MVVNGIDLPSSFERTVGAHKKAYTWTFWSDDVFKEAGIDSVDDIQITLTVYEGETVYGDKLYSDIITFKP